MKTLAIALATTALVALSLSAHAAAAPDFSGYWQHGIGPDAYYLPVPEGGPGPIKHVGPPRPLQQTMWIGEDVSHILQPWAEDVLKRNNALNASDHPLPTMQRTCRPMGTPFVLTFPDAYQLLQTPDTVTTVSSRNMQVRFVYMNQPHSKNLRPTYYGKSVGHYDGDALVVDTIGQNDKTWIDRFGTPHTDQLHVIERYRVVDGGKTLQVRLTFDDPKTFTTVWNAVQNFTRTQGPWEEKSCSENNRAVPGQFNSGVISGGRRMALRTIAIAALILFAPAAWAADTSAPAGKAWIAQSNAYTQTVLDVEFKHDPEDGSGEGLAKYDALITDPSLADALARRKELEAVAARLKAARAQATDKNIALDLEILLKSLDLKFREQDYRLQHEVPFYNASEAVFAGLRTLLDDQVAPERRPAALARLRKYAGIEPGSEPFTEIVKARAVEQMAKPGMIYPSKDEIETALGRDANYADGIAKLFQKYKLAGWEAPYARLKTELADYDAWVRTTILPKARTDFRLPPQAYALALEEDGVDIAPARLVPMAHAAFSEYQADMAPLAAQIAKQRGLPSPDYRAVIAALKKQQITGAAIEPFFKKRLHEIEAIVAAKNLVTLPNRPAIVRLATAAETVQEPAPHMDPPPLVHNTGQRGEFVVPLNIPSANGGAADVYDDFTYDAAAWTMTAHEARPGHELQFDSMVENGVSLARAIYADNSTNVEGWGLYAEYIMQPFEPAEGQLITLQYRLLRAARAFLDPELQSGTITPAEAYKVLEQDVVLSHAFAKEEVERFTFHAPGQANAYFYGLTRLLDLRKETEAALGKKFDQKKFHDFIIAQGLLPPDLLRKAVLEEFVPSQRQ